MDKDLGISNPLTKSLTGIFTITEQILVRWLVKSYGLREKRPRKWCNTSHSAGCFAFYFS